MSQECPQVLHRGTHGTLGTHGTHGTHGMHDTHGTHGTPGMPGTHVRGTASLAGTASIYGFAWRMRPVADTVYPLRSVGAQVAPDAKLQLHPRHCEDRKDSPGQLWSVRYGVATAARIRCGTACGARNRLADRMCESACIMR